MSVTSSGGSHASVNTTATVAEPAPLSRASPSRPSARASRPSGAATHGAVLLDASASAPTGTTATDYDWKLASAPGQDIVCPGTEPNLTLNVRLATNTNLTLTTADAATGVRTRPHRADRDSRSVAARSRASGFGSFWRLTATGVCSGSSVPKVPPLSGHRLSGSVLLGHTSVGGAPPADCDQDLVFGAADVHGCLNQIPDPKDLPGGITYLFSKLLCGAKDSDFCLTSGAFAAARRGGEPTPRSKPPPQKTGQVAAALNETRIPDLLQLHRDPPGRCGHRPPGRLPDPDRPSRARDRRAPGPDLSRQSPDLTDDSAGAVHPRDRRQPRHDHAARSRCR